MDDHGTDVSVIVRFRNEAKFLEAVLQAVRCQRLKGRVEIVAVDDGSQDGSYAIAERYADKILKIDAYRPGMALNFAIQEACGQYIAVLSGHTIPADCDWLSRLRACMCHTRVAGAYGGQVYNIHSKFLDKRVLDIFSTIEPRIETRDSDFWNANSMFPRATWEIQRFDETVYELEDHYWTKLLLPRGYEVRFEPRALVYHYSHIARLDREFLPASSLNERERIAAAIADLERPDADWPQVMMAGLTLSSLTRSPNVQYAVGAIGRQLVQHRDFDVRWRMAQALGKIPVPESADYLVRALQDPSLYPRDEAAWSLARLGAVAAPRLEPIVASLPVSSRPFAALALGRSAGTTSALAAVEVLGRELISGDTRRQRDGAYFAGEIADVYGAKKLVAGLHRLLDGDAELCKVSSWALGCFAEGLDSGIAFGRIGDLADSHCDPLVRFEATVAIGKHARAVRDRTTICALIAKCSDSDARVRYGATQSLRRLAEDGVEFSMRALNDDDPDFGVRFEVALILEARSGQSVSGFSQVRPRRQKRGHPALAQESTR